MLRIPVSPTPSQTLNLTLGGQVVSIALRTNNGSLYFDLVSGSETIVATRICRNQSRMLLDAGYRGFVGDFLFVDTQGETDPVYAGLGSRYQLVYLGAGE